MKSTKFKVGDRVYTDTHAVSQDTQKSLSRLSGMVKNNDDSYNIHVVLDSMPQYKNGVGFSEFELSHKPIKKYKNEEFTTISELVSNYTKPNKKEFKFNVTIVLNEGILGTEKEQYEMAKNIADGLKRQYENDGIAPETSDAFTTEIKVKPQEFIEQIRIKV